MVPRPRTLSMVPGHCPWSHDPGHCPWSHDPGHCPWSQNTLCCAEDVWFHCNWKLLFWLNVWCCSVIVLQCVHIVDFTDMADEFPIRVLPTPLSRNFSLLSNHVLKVSESHLCLYDASGTIPTSFTCPLENVERVDGTHGTGSGVISLRCIK